MGGTQEQRVMKAIGHFVALRRLRDTMIGHPNAEGLEASVRFHMTRAATLASDLCGSAGAVQPRALAAIR